MMVALFDCKYCFGIDFHHKYNYIIIMIAIVFEWDEIKAKNNYRKHGISFDEAKSVFYDEEAVLFFDEIHSVKEDRFILLGKTSKSRIILVCHCYLETKGIIRIFSSRRATKNESKHYPRRKR